MSFGPDSRGAYDRTGRHSTGRTADWRRTGDRLVAWIRSRPTRTGCSSAPAS